MKFPVTQLQIVNTLLYPYWSEYDTSGAENCHTSWTEWRLTL